MATRRKAREMCGRCPCPPHSTVEHKPHPYRPGATYRRMTAAECPVCRCPGHGRSVRRSIYVPAPGREGRVYLMWERDYAGAERPASPDTDDDPRRMFRTIWRTPGEFTRYAAPIGTLGEVESGGRVYRTIAILDHLGNVVTGSLSLGQFAGWAPGVEAWILPDDADDDGAGA